MLPGRRDNAIKNYWNSRTFQAKLRQMSEDGVISLSPRSNSRNNEGIPEGVAPGVSAAAATPAEEEEKKSVTKSGRISKPRRRSGEDDIEKENQKPAKVAAKSRTAAAASAESAANSLGAAAAAAIPELRVRFHPIRNARL